MLKQTISFPDNFNEEITHTEEHYFNLRESDISENLALRDRLEKMVEVINAPQRELSTVEKQELLDIVKVLIRLSHGKRLENGGFRKTQETFQDFQDSGAYNGFLVQLFANPETVFEFILGILPSAVRAQAEKEFAENGGVIPPSVQLTTHPPKQAPEGYLAATQTPVGVPVAPEPKRTYESYTQEELLALSDEEFFDAVGTRDPMQMSKEQMVIGMMRKTNK